MLLGRKRHLFILLFLLTSWTEQLKYSRSQSSEFSQGHRTPRDPILLRINYDSKHNQHFSAQLLAMTLNFLLRLLKTHSHSDKGRLTPIHRDLISSGSYEEDGTGKGEATPLPVHTHKQFCRVTQDT